MTTAPAPAPEADEDGYRTETWTFGGYAKGATTARVAIWYDADRTECVFGVPKGTQPRPGLTYDVQVRRDETGKARSLKHGHAYAGPHPDQAWAAGIQARAAAWTSERERAAMERKAADGGLLAELIAPIEAFAAGLNYDQRAGLAALLAKAVYRARREK